MNSAADIAERVRTGRLTASAVVDEALRDIAARNRHYTCFTRVFDVQARSQAAEIDALIARGEDTGPLAGVPFAVKDLFDVEGEPTTAGAYMRANAPAATADAECVKRLKAAGAILIGTLNMDAFAYGFATVNAHYGTTRNPYDPERLAGGSSGGSAAAVAGALVPIALGSDTNGSIRVPASLCGVWGIRPGEGVIPIDGAYPFVETLDTVGPFARSAADLEMAFRVLSGRSDAVRPVDPSQLRVARLSGYFETDASPEALAGVERALSFFPRYENIEIQGAQAARSAAFLLSAAEGGSFHLPELSRRASDYDPAVRDRLLAGAMLPASTYIKARAFRERFKAEITSVFERFDVIVAPATPVHAPLISDPTVLVGGVPTPARANLGMYTQPLGFSGIPIAGAPVRMHHHGQARLPIGVQIAMSWGKDLALLDLLRQMESTGHLGYVEPGLGLGAAA